MNAYYSAFNLMTPFTYKVKENGSCEKIKNCSTTQKISVLALSVIAAIGVKLTAPAAAAVLVSTFLVLSTLVKAYNIWRHIPTSPSTTNAPQQGASCQNAGPTPDAIRVHINQKARPVLDELFANSSYKIDTLPVYPILLTRNESSPTIDNVSAPIMKGAGVEGVNFITLRVRSSEGKKSLIFLTNCSEGPYFWDRRGRYEYAWYQLQGPRFFTSNFTCIITGILTDSQKKNFTQVQNLISGEQVKDLDDKTWQIY